MPLFFRKVLIVPYILKDDDIFVLLFHDKKHQEWTLLSGGCKKGEKPFQSGIRELSEESNATLCFPKHKTRIHYFRFLTNYVHNTIHKYKEVLTVYHVYLFPLDEKDIHVLQKKYFSASLQNDETENIQFFRLDDICFQENLRIWSFIRDACADYIIAFFKRYITTKVRPPPLIKDYDFTKSFHDKRTWYLSTKDCLVI